jgi:alpha-L-rhamnosidase
MLHLCLIASLSCGVLFGLQTDPAPELGSVFATHLTVEHRLDPEGLATDQPRFGWWLGALDPAARGLSQSGYRLRVASRLELLEQDQPDLWDSGYVPARESVDIAYGGEPLRSGQEAYWQVQVTDGNARASAWSAPARFSLGLLHPEDWSAQWIGFDGPLAGQSTPFGSAAWLGFPGGMLEAPATTCRFEFDFAVSEELAAARLRISADDQWRLFLDGAEVSASDGLTDAWRRVRALELDGARTAGQHRLEVLVTNSKPGPAGLLLSLDLTAGDGTVTRLVSGPGWRVAPEGGQAQPAPVLGAYGLAPWGTLATGLHLPPARLLRCGFELKQPPSRATLHWTALGAVDVRLNGKWVSDGRLTPGWTDYKKRVLARSADVTGLLNPGANALAALLADGWYAGYVGYGGQRDHYGPSPRLSLELHLEFADGSRQTLLSDGDWRAATGQVLEADLLMGETWDARLEPLGWERPGFDDSGWSPVDLGAPLTPRREPHPGPPVRAVATFTPVASWKLGPGRFAFDLGQNIAGVARLQVAAQPGQRFTLRFAERLDERRELYTQNLRGARATDVFIARGAGREVFEPRFTFHGFQYVEVDGLDPALESAPADLLVGVALSSDTPYGSEFWCSEPALERLVENIRWTQRMNFIDVPTDCPQRDERLGWTGDALAYGVTAAWNADVRAFFGKWLTDLSDAQRADGQFPMVAPLLVAGDDGGPAWADCGAILPWELYSIYGDRRMLERQYPAMQRYLDFLVARSGPERTPPAEFHCFGDWVHLDAPTPPQLIYLAYFARSAECLASTARALHAPKDAARYQTLWSEVRAAFQRTCVEADGHLTGNSQCGYALALAFDLLDEPQRSQAASFLAADIEARGLRFNTGFVGTAVLLQALEKAGRRDLAAALVLRREYPSWLFAVEQGATSIWERWDGWTPERGFQDPGMNSFAHYAFGCVGRWLFESLVGISIAPVGHQRLRLTPAPIDGLTSAGARYDSIRGPVTCAWERTPAGLVIEVNVPPNLMAALRLPCDASVSPSVTESGRPLGKDPHVRQLSRVITTLGAGSPPAPLELEVDSGHYRFLIPMR